MTNFRTAPRQTNDSPIARLRIQRGLTQSQLAAMIGCSTQHISRWETGGRNPGGKSLVALANALQCSIEELISKREDV